MSDDTPSSEDRRIRTAERRARVIELRRRRVSFRDIGADLGVTPQRAHQIYSDALREIPAMQLELHRAEELALIDDAIADLWPVAHNHALGRTAVDAWEGIRGWAERKAKLLGLDAPVRLSVDAEQLGREIEELLAAAATPPGLDDDDDDDGAAGA